MATITKIEKATINDIKAISANTVAAMQERTYNLSAGMTKDSYDFSELSYERDVREINGVERQIWYLYDKDGQRVAASAFFAHDEKGENFSGFTGNDVYSLVQWLLGKTLVKTERKANLWGAKFDKGELVERNADLGEERHYYEVKKK